MLFFEMTSPVHFVRRLLARRRLRQAEYCPKHFTPLTNPAAWRPDSASVLVRVAFSEAAFCEECKAEHKVLEQAKLDKALSVLRGEQR
jgi:hypothetical protein